MTHTNVTNLTPALRAEARSLHDAGHTHIQIAQALTQQSGKTISHRSIRNLAQTAHWPEMPRTRIWTREREAEGIRLRLLHRTDAEIFAALNAMPGHSLSSPDLVTRHRAHCGWPTPPIVAKAPAPARRVTRAAFSVWNGRRIYELQELHEQRLPLGEIAWRLTCVPGRGRVRLHDVLVKLAALGLDEMEAAA